MNMLFFCKSEIYNKLVIIFVHRLSTKFSSWTKFDRIFNSLLLKAPFLIIDHGKGRPPHETKNAQVLTNEVKLLTPRCKYTILSGMGKCSDVMKMTSRTFFCLKIVSNSNLSQFPRMALASADCC